MEVCVGKILTISELNVQILLNGEKVKYHDILYTNIKGKEVLFEVTEEDGTLTNVTIADDKKLEDTKIRYILLKNGNSNRFK